MRRLVGVCILVLCACGDDTNPVADAAMVDGHGDAPMVDGNVDHPMVDATEMADAALDAAQVCGNGIVEGSEACDDGNTSTETQCPYGTATCTRCNATCTTVLRLTGPTCGDGTVNGPEICDDGNTSTETQCPYGIGTCTRCSADCSTVLNLTGPVCGDGVINGPETCDDGNTLTETQCPYGLGTCTRCSADCGTVLNLTGPACGDGTRDAQEVCDDGNTSTETECAYGVPTCTTCSADCQTVLHLTGPFCGDGLVNGPEVCDDGNTVTETSCPYGAPTCTLCNGSCSQPLNLAGPYCGDGLLNGPEACDDGNSNACGSCDATCSNVRLATATGSIIAVAGNRLSDGETFTINDGVHTPTVLEFDIGDGVGGAGRIPVLFNNTLTATGVAGSMRASINGVGSNLGVSAGGSTATVLLSNVSPGTFGNQALTETVADPGFTVSGMSGGGGRDCPLGTGCISTNDCQRGLTCATTCQ
jgi:cysteine-rich repeat protein